MNPFVTHNDVLHERSALKCPACHSQLWLSTDLIAKSVTLHCGQGSCRSQACNDGATAHDADEALATMTNNFQVEKSLSSDVEMTDDEAREFLRSVALLAKEDLR